MLKRYENLISSYKGDTDASHVIDAYSDICSKKSLQERLLSKRKHENLALFEVCLFYISGIIDKKGWKW